MKRLVAAVAVCGMALATACTGDTEDPADTGDEVAESTTPNLEGIVPEGYGVEIFEECDEDAVTAAMADLVAAAGVEFAGEDPNAPMLVCTWDGDPGPGPSINLHVYSTGSETMGEYLEESETHQLIDDARFDEIGVAPAIAMGCEDGIAAGIIGCAIMGYGADTSIGLQVLSAETVTLDQMVDALWELSSAIND